VTAVFIGGGLVWRPRRAFSHRSGLFRGDRYSSSFEAQRGASGSRPGCGTGLHLAIRQESGGAYFPSIAIHRAARRITIDDPTLASLESRKVFFQTLRFSELPRGFRRAFLPPRRPRDTGRETRARQ